MLLFEIAQYDNLFTDRQNAAFRLYLTDASVQRHADETLHGYHRESLAVLALEKPGRMGITSCRRCLYDRRYRFRRALDELARGCQQPIKISFIPFGYPAEATAAGFYGR